MLTHRQQARIFTSARYLIATHLLRGPSTMSNIARKQGLKRQAVWHHLQAFMKAGLVRRRFGEKGYVYELSVDRNKLMRRLPSVKINNANSVRQAVCRLCGTREKKLLKIQSLRKYICVNCLQLLAPVYNAAGETPRRKDEYNSHHEKKKSRKKFLVPRKTL